MSFSVGIVGLPNVGKSTLFKALTKIKVNIAPYPFTTIDPNIGIVQVPDERLQKIAQVIEPKKITPTIIEFIDIAGLVKNAHKGEGLGNQFLAQIRNCDAILQVVRAFKGLDTKEIIDPQNEIETIKLEFELKDLESKETENLLSKKPIIYLLNTSKETSYIEPKISYIKLNLKDEEDISELTENEKKELKVKTALDQLILACYNTLDLITFYTITGGEETRAWTLKKGLTAPKAGGVVHTDFEEKFIRAEVIPWDQLIAAKSWQKAKEKGQLRTTGRDYIVQDGDVIEFKI